MRRIVVGMLVLLSVLAMSTQVQGQEGTVISTSPTWGLLLHGLYDPYTGKLSKPAAPPPETRIVGVDVEIVNDGPGSLTLGTNPIILRDAAGVDYPGGQV